MPNVYFNLQSTKAKIIYIYPLFDLCKKVVIILDMIISFVWFCKEWNEWALDQLMKSFM